MGRRRLRVATSDDEEDADMMDIDKKETKPSEDEKDEEEGGQEEDGPEDAKPVGDVIKVTGKGKKRKRHYKAFDFEGNIFEIEDSVLLTPDDKKNKPYVAIIKDITQEVDGSMMVTGQWFYRPEEAKKESGSFWEARDTRQLFYSFHLDEVPAESVMHKCVVHFVPLNKKIPLRSENPGFIVQRVYDVVQKKLWKLTDKDYEDNKQLEINLLVQKTIKRIGELPDIEPDIAPADQADQTTSKKSIRKKNMQPIDVSRTDVAITRMETPGSCPSDVSEYHLILSNFKALTHDRYRDKWLEKLLEGIQTACSSKQDGLVDDRKDGFATSDHDTNDNTDSTAVIGSKDKLSEDGERVMWPDAAVEAVTALEKASHETLGSDSQRYNTKMRQLIFNLKSNALLSRRLLNKELDPVVVVNMTPNELKDGVTAEEKKTKEPEESKIMQMTDARCSRCSKKEAGVADVIHASHGDRYQLECQACGHTWYTSRDEISSLTINTTNVAGNVGTAPWATAKFEDVERKKLLSPREGEKPEVDIFHKSTAPYMPVLESQKSFNRSKADAE